MSKRRYTPKHVHQDDGSRCQWTNCWACVGVWLLDGATRGKKRVTPMQFRRRAGAMKGCRTGGLGDIMRGLAAYGVTSRLLSDVSIPSAKKRWASKTSTKLYAVETDFEEWPKAAKCDVGKDFDGYHMVGIAPGATIKNGKRAIRTMDPNQCRKLKRVSMQGVVAAARSYNNEHAEKPNTIDMLVVDTKR